MAEQDIQLASNGLPPLPWPGGIPPGSPLVTRGERLMEYLGRFSAEEISLANDSLACAKREENERKAAARAAKPWYEKRRNECD